MKLVTIINADTREGWLGEKSAIGQYGNVNLCGCRSADFLTEATIARNRYLDSPLVTSRETVLCIDIHQSITPDVRDRLDQLIRIGELTRTVERSHDRSAPRWNDRIYCRAFEEIGDADLVAHWDGDCIGYRRTDFDVLSMYLGHLDSGASYVCQQTPLSKAEHCMEHASTRFFLTKKGTLDFQEAEYLLNDRARAKRFPGMHLPCLEHILGAMSGNRVLYPDCSNDDFVVWSWVHYYHGIIAKLNDLPYEDVKRYVFETCGGPLGASDLIGKPLL